MSTGFTFGAKTTAPTFGETNTLSFGTTPTTTQFGFGSNAQPQTGFQLGGTTPNKAIGSTSAPQPSGFSFGTPSSIASSLGFGNSSSTAASTGTGFGFGSNNPAVTTSSLSFGNTPSLGTSFGLGAPQSTAVNLTLGGATTTTPTFGLGTTPSLNTTSGTTGFTLGGITTTSTTPGFSLGGLTSTAPTLNFGTSTTGSTSSTLSTGFPFGSISAAPTFNFGTTSTSSTAGLPLSFGSTPTTVTTTTASSSTSSTTAPDKVGLGGIQTSASSSLNAKTAKEVPPKEQQVPNEIQQDIENFKNYIKQQKLYSSDVSRCCVSDFRNVETQISVLHNVIKEIESQLQKNQTVAEKLKYDTAQGLQLLEMAQRTQDTPAGLQYENVAPMHFFLNLADNFEKEMHALKIQIENTDKYVKNFGQPATLTSQDLSQGMKRLHDTFVALAGRLQSVHTQVESQKELYINLRKQLVNDFTNPFESLDKKINSNPTTSIIQSPPKIACGPTPFNQILSSNFPIASQQNATTPYTGTGFEIGSSTNILNSFSRTNTGLPNTSVNTGFGFNTSLGGSSFQLQKPPTGNKRGKQ